MKTHLGHYEIVSELGRGGMGVVYKGFEPSLARHVAIKELSPSLAHDHNLVERFLREARSMAALNDPHIIQIYFIGQDDATNQPFFVMEFVEGDSLSQVLKREGKLSVENALKIVHQTAQGLATAHDKGVVHRDIKPGNLMLTPRGQVKIADFGIALASTDFSKKLTSTGEFVGTPGYLSPEVCLGKQVDQRSDIFSLGIVLYEMLSGDTPFHDQSPLGLMLEVVKSEIPDIRGLNDEVDAQTAQILTRMVAKEPGERYQSCHELAAALESHPLVARGGAVKLAAAAPRLSDATVVGAPTPASQPQRIPTPPPRVSTPAPQGPPPLPAAAMAAGQAGAGAAAQAGQGAAAAEGATRVSAGRGARPSVLERSHTRSSPALPLAIAALLVLLLAGGAWAFRAPLTAFAGGLVGAGDGDSASLALADGAGADTAAAANDRGAAATGANGANGSVADDAAGADAGLALEPVAGDDGRIVPAPLQDDTVDANDALAGDANADSTGADAQADTGGAATENGAAVVDTALAANTEGGRSAVAAPAQEPVATKRAAEGRSLASVTEPRRQAPVRAPRIAVVSLGDSAITSPAEQRIESALMRAGFDVVDESLIGGMGEDPAAVLRALRGEAEVLVLVRAEGIGSQELQYYEQTSTLYSAYLGVRAFSIDDRRPLGPGFRDKVDFTTLNAQEKAMEIIEPGLDTLVTDLGPYRRAGRG